MTPEVTGIPPGKVVVHNHVRPQADMSWWPPRLDGFCAWAQLPDDELEVCPCPWARLLPVDYRMAAVPHETEAD